MCVLCKFQHIEVPQQLDGRSSLPALRYSSSFHLCGLGVGWGAVSMRPWRQGLRGQITETNKQLERVRHDLGEQGSPAMPKW